MLVSMAADYPDRVAGVVYGRDTVVRRLREVGCSVRETRQAAPTIAPWRAEAPVRRRVVAGPARGRARGDPAELAAGPDRPRRPGRGGHPAGRLRERPGPDAARAGRARAHPAAAAAPVGGPDAGRGRLRGGAVVAVRAAFRRGPARAAARGHAPPGGGGGEPAQRGRAAAAHDRAARAVPGPDPQRRAGLRRHRAVRDRPGLPAPPRGAAGGADPPGRPRPHGGRARLPRGRPAGPAAADRRRADRGARARRLVGQGTRGVLGRRDRGGPRGGPDLPGAARGPGRRRTRPGIPAAAPPSTPRSATPTDRGSGWPGTPASCTRG